jgi:hypothetical protein
MARKRYKPEEIVAKLRQVDVLVSHGMQQAEIVEDLKNTSCPPVTAETDQLRLIVERWVQENPKTLARLLAWAVPQFLLLLPNSNTGGGDAGLQPELSHLQFAQQLHP